MTAPTRRQFLRTATAAGLGLLAGPGRNYATAAPTTEQPWSFSLLGDIHYDQLDHHDFEWVEREQGKDRSQIESYSRITKENLPALLGHLKQTIAATPDCRFLIQIGDLVQGLCGSEALARKQCQDAIAFLSKQEFDQHILVTKGNHDITGPGAAKAYDEVILPFITNQVAPSAATLPARFTHERGDTLFVFYDAYDRTSLEWFEELVARETSAHLFFVIHPPVVPYNARSSWCVFNNDPERRIRLLNALGRSRAIVLSGHLHKYALVERDTAEGPFTQLAVSSVAYRLDDEPRDLLSGLDAYTPSLVDLEPAHSPETIDARREILTREKPHLRRFDYGDFWGHAMIRIDGPKVDAGIYQGLTPMPWINVPLAG